MGIPLGEMLARLPEDRRRRVEARTEALVAEEMTLRDLRKALGKTQTTVAQKLGMKQENVSRFEQRADMLLSTLDTHLRALGGRLHLLVEFKGRAPVRLAGLATIEAKEKHPTLTTGTGRAVAAAKRGKARHFVAALTEARIKPKGSFGKARTKTAAAAQKGTRRTARPTARHERTGTTRCEK